MLNAHEKQKKNKNGREKWKTEPNGNNLGVHLYMKKKPYIHGSHISHIFDEGNEGKKSERNVRQYIDENVKRNIHKFARRCYCQYQKILCN